MESDSPLVDVHAHFTTDRYIEMARAAGHVEPDGMPATYWPRWTAEAHVELMDKVGIKKAILSVSSPGVHFGDDEAACALAREVNDVGAEAARAYPGRFGVFASLPMPDIAGSLTELARAFDHLGAAGAILMTNSGGLYLGDERLEPLLAELDRRSAVVFLHPTSTKGHEYVDCGRPRPMMEFLFDTARSVVDYVLSGHAERYPNIRLIVPHAGGVIPLLAERVQLFDTVFNPPHPRSARELLRHFYYDLAGTPSRLQLAALDEVTTRDRLLYGSDYPWTPTDLVARLMSGLDKVFDATDGEWRKLTTRNAEKLLAR